MIETEKEKRSRIYLIIGALVLILILWFTSWYYIDSILLPSNGNEVPFSDRGAFGDKFGFINSLFSGLALTGIIISIFFQQKELSLQRNELIETRQEFKEQNFQTTFFNLLKTQRQLAEDISISIQFLKYYNSDDKIQIEGRKFFNRSKFELKRILKALDFEDYSKFEFLNEIEQYELDMLSEWERNDMFKSRKTYYTNSYYNISKEKWNEIKEKDDLEKAKEAYIIFFKKYNYVVGHYFRHLYHILNFLEENRNEKRLDKKLENDKMIVEEEFQQFANFVQAQLSTPELFLLFYNALAFPKLQRLLIEFNILENLPKEELISSEHNNIKNINLKSHDDLLV